MKKTITKEKGERALNRKDKRQYHDAVNEERRAEEDGERRESRDTGGSSASNEAAAPQVPTSVDQAQEEDEQETEEGRLPKAMTVPEGPSRREREVHELTHIPYRSWCEHCVKARARRRGHRRRDEEIKKQELRRVTRIYIYGFLLQWSRRGGGGGGRERRGEK